MTVHALLCKAVRGHHVSKAEVQLLQDHFAPVKGEDGPNFAKIAATINSPETQATLEQDVDDAIKAAEGAIKAFSDIGVTLRTIDDKNLTTTKYYGGWEDLAKSFRAAMWASRDDAITMSVFYNDYVNGFLPKLVSPTVEAAVKKELLAALIKEVDKYKDTAQATSELFIELAKKVEAFGVDFKTFADDKIDFLTKEVKHINEIEIPALKAEIAVLAGQIVTYGALLGVSIAAAAIGGALVFAFPLYGALLLVAGLAGTGAAVAELIETIKKKSDKESELDNKEAKVTADTAALGDIATAQFALNSTGVGMGKIAGGLGKLSKTWDFVRIDLEYLAIQFGLKEGTPPVAWTTFDASTAIYNSLKSAMDKYVADTINFDPKQA